MIMFKKIIQPKTKINYYYSVVAISNKLFVTSYTQLIGTK
jgi:hypothetical protein